MNDDRTGKRRPSEREQERELQARDEGARAPEQKQKPSPIERREWRGSGVCGDRHTD